jgi:hypothetical protein
MYLHHSKITEAVNKIKRTLPNLLHYFDIAKQVLHECSNLPVDGESLKSLRINQIARPAVKKNWWSGTANFIHSQSIFGIDDALGIIIRRKLDNRRIAGERPRRVRVVFVRAGG